MEGPSMEQRGKPLENGASFFRNVACPYFPCHGGVDEGEFNCLFCYCPLYALGPDCGGNYAYTEAGIKDCSNCTMLHRGDAGGRIVMAKFAQLADLARESEPDSHESR